MDAALKLLKFRGRSERELAAALKKKKFPEHIVADTLARLIELGLVNDAKLAASWTEGGRQRGWGKRRIEQFLFKRGIERGDIQAALAAEPENEKAIPEPERAWDALLRRAKRMPLERLTRDALYRRLSSFLERQGFEIDVVRDAVQKFLKQHPPQTKETESEYGTDNP